MNNEVSETDIEKRRAYAREYQRKRYAEKHTEVRNYCNSVRYKNRHNLSDEDYKKYGSYLHLVDKVRKAKDQMPSELWASLIGEI
jgi:hypothetical protein